MPPMQIMKAQDHVSKLFCRLFWRWTSLGKLPVTGRWNHYRRCQQMASLWLGMMLMCTCLIRKARPCSAAASPEDRSSNECSTTVSIFVRKYRGLTTACVYHLYRGAYCVSHTSRVWDTNPELCSVIDSRHTPGPWVTHIPGSEIPRVCVSEQPLFVLFWDAYPGMGLVAIVPSDLPKYEPIFNSKTAFDNVVLRLLEYFVKFHLKITDDVGSQVKGHVLFSGYFSLTALSGK